MTQIFKLNVYLLLAVTIGGAAFAQEAAPERSFAEAYQNILDRSLRILTQKAEIRASEERKRIQVGNFLPTATLSWSDTRYGQPFTGPIDGSFLGASINLFRSGGDLAGLNAAKQDLIRNREQFLSERLGAEEDALEGLFTFVQRIQQRAVDDEILRLRTESLRIAQERFDRGLLASQEVDKVSVDLENSRSTLIDARSAEATARAQLKNLLGDDHVHADWPWKEIIINGRPIENIDFKIEARPDWRVLQANVAEQEFKKRQALGTLLPTIDFTAGFGTDPSDQQIANWRTVMLFSVPLFNGFKDYGAYQIQDVALIESQYQLEGLRRQAPPDVESLKLNHKAARESALSREKTAEISQRLYGENMRRFQLGRVTANDIALDQDRVLQSHLHEVDGWSNAHLTYARLCHGLGGSVSQNASCVFE